MRYVVEYGLYEEPDHEFNREFENMEEVHAWIGVMEGLMSYYHIYDKNGNEID